jgi:multidrug transporter EmrE-like cation transporter
MNSLLGPDKAGLLNWLLFAVTGVVAYVLLSLFGQLGGGSSNSAVGAFLAAFKPIPFVLLIIGNALWGVAVYFGLQNTKYAIPAVIALGIITSFLYSLIVFENPVTWWRLLDLGLVILGIYFIQ